MGKLGRISAYNLLILVLYSALIWVWALNVKLEGYDKLAPLFLLAILIGLQTLVNAILSIVFFTKKDKEKALPFLLSTFVVPVVGFSTCYGGAVVAGL